MTTQKLSTSGIKELETGERVIPASIRPDGSERRERKVRAGFIPIEDRVAYTPPPTQKLRDFEKSNFGRRPVVNSKCNQNVEGQEPHMTKTAKKNLKRKEARRQAKENGIQSSKVTEE